MNEAIYKSLYKRGKFGFIYIIKELSYTRKQHLSYEYAKNAVVDWKTTHEKLI